MQHLDNTTSAPTPAARQWQARLAALASEEKAAVLRRFFKTGPGEYGEGDLFRGITVPQVREVSKLFSAAPLDAVDEMLGSPYHEDRLSALLTLVEQYRLARRDEERRRAIVDFYVARCHRADNWDLVDLSAPKILGLWLVDHPDPELLDRLSLSESLWEQRTAIVGTLALIRADRYADTLRLAERYLTHGHDLIHKATGWMLREVGKRDEATLIAFLDRHAPRMPRTALRYAIERLDAAVRRRYLAAKSATLVRKAHRVK